MVAAACRVVLVAAAAAAISAPAAGAAVPGFAPHLHRDPVEHRQDPLDLRAAAFGQVGTQLSLTLRTRGAWRPAGSLCVTLLRDAPVGRVCVAGKRTHPILRFRAAHSSHSRTVRGADVTRRGRTLRALLYPRALGLGPGPLR